MSEKAATSVRHAHSVGKKQCPEEEEQVGSVKKNILALFQSRSIVTVSKVKRKKTELTERIQLYSSLYVCCKSRQVNPDEFFHHENITSNPHRFLTMVAFAKQL